MIKDKGGFRKDNPQCDQDREAPEGGLVYIRLFHGRRSPDMDMDDWGTEGPCLGPFRWVHPSYTHRIWLGRQRTWGQELFLSYYEDLVYYDGVFYGDHSIVPTKGGLDNGQVLEFPTEDKLALPPVLHMKCVMGDCDVLERRAIHQHPVRCSAHQDSPGMTVAREGMTSCSFCRAVFFRQLGYGHFPNLGITCPSCTILSNNKISTTGGTKIYQNNK